MVNGDATASILAFDSRLRRTTLGDVIAGGHRMAIGHRPKRILAQVAVPGPRGGVQPGVSKGQADRCGRRRSSRRAHLQTKYRAPLPALVVGFRNAG